jgi:hypothetical protein
MIMRKRGVFVDEHQSCAAFMSRADSAHIEA